MFASVSGCQRISNTPPERLNPEPIVVDEAMQHRDWPEQNAYYTNTSVVARPTGERYEVKPDLGAERRHIYVDPVVWAGNTLLMPVVLIANPPWTPVAYRAETIAPTYTAQPPLEADAGAGSMVNVNSDQWPTAGQPPR